MEILPYLIFTVGVAGFITGWRIDRVNKRCAKLEARAAMMDHWAAQMNGWALTVARPGVPASQPPYVDADVAARAQNVQRSLNPAAYGQPMAYGPAAYGQPMGYAPGPR